VGQLLGLENHQLFYGNFIRTKIKVGTEGVFKSQNANQVINKTNGNYLLMKLSLKNKEIIFINKL